MYRSKARRKMAHDVILKILRLEQLGFEEVVSAANGSAVDQVNEREC
jgi:hypothetical protein